MRRIDRAQSLFLAFLGRHRSDDAHAQSQRDIFLNHVRIHGGEHDVGIQLCFLESRIDMAAAGKAHVISDQRIAGQLRQVDLVEGQQRMALRHRHHMVPAIAGKRHEIVELA